MRRLLVLLLLLLSGLAALAKVPDGFFSSWEGVRQAARERHVLIYLHFTTDWCGWCRKIEAETYTDARVKHELATNFAAASLNCTVPEGEAPSGPAKTNLALFEKYGGSGYPFLIVLSPDGATIYQIITGYLPADAFLQRLHEAKKTEQAYQAFQQYAATADKSSYDYALRAMRMMLRVYRAGAASAMAKAVRKLDPDNTKGDAAEAAWIVLQSIPAEKWESEGLAYLAAIDKYDADNAQRFLEHARWDLALSAFDRKLYPKCIASLNGLISAAKSLEDKQNTYGLLGIAYHENGNLDKAISSLETAIQCDPGSERGQWLKEKLEAFKREKK